MNAKQRVKGVIARKPVDMVPYSFDLTSVITGKIAERMNVQPRDVHSAIGDNMLYVGPGGPGGPRGFTQLVSGENHITDEFGVVWDRSQKALNAGDWGGIVSSPLAGPDLARYVTPDGHAPGRFEHLNDNELVASGRYVILGMDGLFDRGWHIRGFENLLTDFACEEEFVCDLLERILEFNLGLIDQAPDYIDGIRFGEDWGHQGGMLMGAAYWRKYLKKRLGIMYGAAKKRGFDVLIHSCGDIHEIFPDLIEIGVDAVHPVQPEVMDVLALKREYGKDIVLYGGMGSQSTIPKGTVTEVLEEAKMLIDNLSVGGGYIFGPAGAIPNDAKMDNVMALIDFVMNKDNLCPA